ncbi:hypothetical protein C3433_25340 [Citrobacter freundii]|uniref:Uncharacterized protein n=1 Tax=Citrobacter arsenatis TaxID=2546350 RepID=A0A4P6WHF5_9ENTR|nr:hypothetical protein C3433_25340 [Citrobacter freundii]QBM21316.1 hypothetical protein E1B03_02230 [Citrobacter arsenatis]
MSESFPHTLLALYQRLGGWHGFVNDCLRAVCASTSQKSTTIIGLSRQRCYYSVAFMYKNR